MLVVTRPRHCFTTNEASHFVDYFCVSLSARPRIGAGNRRLFHGVLDETWHPLRLATLISLLGSPSDAPVVTYYTQTASAEITESARTTVDLVQADRTRWAVEELVAMKFAYIKHLAELVASEKVTDGVVTILPYYSQLERDSFADAIEISDLRTLDTVQTAVKGLVGEYAPCKISLLLFLTRSLAIRLP